MTRYLLDTNIISNAVKPAPSAALAAWMSAQADEDLFISAITLAEIRRGVLERPMGRKRRELDDWVLRARWAFRLVLRENPGV